MVHTAQHSEPPPPPPPPILFRRLQGSVAAGCEGCGGRTPCRGLAQCDKHRFSAESRSAAKGSEFHTTFDETDETAAMGAARVEELRALAASPDIHDRLVRACLRACVRASLRPRRDEACSQVRALAPSIFQLDDVKKGILALLFGGVCATAHRQRNVLSQKTGHAVFVARGVLDFFRVVCCMFACFRPF